MYTEYLTKAYTKFIHVFPDFPFKQNEIKLWYVKPDEYVDYYYKAHKSLQISTNATSKSLSSRSLNFRAEIIKSDKSAIILINRTLNFGNNEIIKILLHELAHLYSDSKFYNLSFVEIKDKFDYHLFQFSIRIWREFMAEWYSNHIQAFSPLTSYDAIRNDFFALMYNKEIIPEMLGFFLSKCQIYHLSSFDLMRILGLDLDSEHSSHLVNKLISLTNTLVLIKENQNTLKTVQVLISIGRESYEFFYYYLLYFNHLETFINEIE